MRATMWIAGALLVVASQVALLGCGGGESSITCDETGCECRERENCVLDCGDLVGCQPTCLGFGKLCETTCFDDCEFRCRQGPNCSGLCGDNCFTTCSSTDTCSIETGASSEYRCLNANVCQVELGNDSTAVCTSVNNCNVRCAGTCTVACIDTGTCSIDCQQGERTDCGQGLFTCGIPCP